MGSGVGLFGKTQFRRDFLTVNVPRPLLACWEGWLARGLARSRERIGSGWTPLFLTMPVWHGALGPGVCGVTAAIAVMPSMDGAGRCFPLSVIGWSDEAGAAVGWDAWRDWAVHAQAFLVGTLDENGSHEDTLAGLGRMPGFPAALPGEAPAVPASRSLWWTEGGERAVVDRLEADGLPDADALSAMIGEAPAPIPSREDERHVG